MAYAKNDFWDLELSSRSKTKLLTKYLSRCLAETTSEITSLAFKVVLVSRFSYVGSTLGPWIISTKYSSPIKGASLNLSKSLKMMGSWGTRLPSPGGATSAPKKGERKNISSNNAMRRAYDSSRDQLFPFKAFPLKAIHSYTQWVWRVKEFKINIFKNDQNCQIPISIH